MSAAHRYVAYTSDIGESFRPVAHPKLIRTAYGISWLYLTGDVAHEGYKAYIANQAMLHGGRSISSVPDFLQPKEPSTVTTAKRPSSEHTYKPYEVSKSVVNPLTTPPPPYQTKPRRASPLSDARNDYEDGSKDDSHLLRPVGKVGFLEDYRTVMVQRAVFQVLASMALPAFTIHSVCSFSLKLGIYERCG